MVEFIFDNKLDTQDGSNSILKKRANKKKIIFFSLYVSTDLILNERYYV